MFIVDVDIYETYRTSIKVAVNAKDLQTAREMVRQDGADAYKVVEEDPPEYFEKTEEVL